MKNTKTITGKVTNLERLESSVNGNPRYAITINGEQYRTKVDAALGYAATNYEGKLVTAVVGCHYGYDTVEDIREIL